MVPGPINLVNFNPMFNFTNNGGRKNLNHLRGDVDYWHRPGGAILEVINYCKGSKKIDYDSLENKYKEIFIGFLFLATLEKAQNKKFFIAKTKNDPPDFVFMFVRKERKGGKDRIWLTSREVEVVRNVKSIEDVEKTVLSKDKNYPKDMTVLCYVETPGVLGLESLSKNVCSKLKNIDNIFILFHGGVISDHKKGHENMISLVQISPQFIKYSWEINLEELVDNFIKDEEKLVYTKDGSVYYGKKSDKDEYPKLVK